MDIFKKSLAPITEKGWEEINEEAKRAFKSLLTARKFVTIDGPHGFEASSVSTGKLDIPENQEGEVKYGIRQVLPLIEPRIPFKLNIWELDNLERGAEDVDLDPVAEAACKISEFEERAIYHGLKSAGIEGLLPASEFEHLSLPDNSHEFLKAISEAVTRFERETITGPYTLVINPKKWHKLISNSPGYPLQRQVREIIEGQIIENTNIDGALMVKDTTEDLVMTLGQDLSIGYESHDEEFVKLYFTETFTFQIFEPKAVMVFDNAR
ncbi:MAG: family 1 encapsulin nanocompartment shell protein [Bacteroidales bacterium]